MTHHRRLRSQEHFVQGGAPTPAARGLRTSASAYPRIATRLVRVPSRELGDEYLPAAEMGVQFGARNYRQPDVVVRSDVSPTGKWLAPTDILLAVEVVSVVADDRSHHQARAVRGCGHRRVLASRDRSGGGADGLCLEPGADVYTELGTWRAGQTVTLTRPFPVTFEVDSLLR
ncbi:MAG: Uma2 family endonuclease [Aeromicrobium sp.]|uniref:hypothetical protein n=1 Tax=Aeromicrobium sp. TaxID=1871063 RepID=UPI0039E493B4